MSNASFEASLPPGWITGYLSDEMCGCDMYAEPGDVDAGEQAEGTLCGLRIDVRRSIAELARAAGSARVLVHFFSRGVDEEEVPASEEQLSAGRFLADGSLVQPDVWYEITDSSGV